MSPQTARRRALVLLRLLPERTCADCHTSIESRGHRAERCEDCAEARARSRRLARQRELTRLGRADRRCKDCSEPIATLRADAFRCTVCSKRHNAVETKAKMREYQRAYRARKRAERFTEVKRVFLQSELQRLLNSRPTLAACATELGIPLHEAQLLLRSSFPDNRPYRQEAA